MPSKLPDDYFDHPNLGSGGKRSPGHAPHWACDLYEGGSKVGQVWVSEGSEPGTFVDDEGNVYGRRAIGLGVELVEAAE
jgi:hypothetical protein